VKLRHYLSILLALAAVAGVGGTVYLRGADEFGEMEVRAVAGDVEIRRGNSVVAVGAEPEALEPQDVVVTGRDGLAELQLEDGRTISLQTKTRLRIRSTDAVEPQAGTILAVANGAPTQVLFDDVTARFSDATLRVDRGFGSARAATFEGRARLESAGEPRVELTQLMQVEVAAGDLPQNAMPYRLDVRDTLDREYLREVVTLTQDLDLLATGFARQLGSSRPGLGYFADVAGTNVGFMESYLSRPLPDLLVGFTIANNDPDVSFSKSFKLAFKYMDQGASYGVAAALLDVKPQPLVAQLEGMIVGSGAVAADGGAGDAALGGDGGAGGVAASDDTTLASGDDETVSGGVEGETTEDVADCTDVVDCGVQDVQDELPPGPGPGPGTEPEDPPGGTSLPGDDLLNSDSLIGSK